MNNANRDDFRSQAAREEEEEEDDCDIPMLLLAESYETVETAEMNNSNETMDLERGVPQPHGAAMATAEEDNDNECPICMSPMIAGEIVSWSPNAACSHVYHHECIKEWLLHHVNCPFCRETFLLCDEKPKQKLTRARYNELAALRRQRLVTTYFCEHDGLVVLSEEAAAVALPLDEKFRKSPGNKLVRHPLVASGVKKGELTKIRGSRVDQQTAPSDKEESVDHSNHIHGGDTNDCIDPIAQTLNPTFSNDYDDDDDDDDNAAIDEVSTQADEGATPQPIIQIQSLSHGTVQMGRPDDENDVYYTSDSSCGEPTCRSSNEP